MFARLSRILLIATILFAGTSGNNSQDAFVSKLNASGSELLFSTYLGGTGVETGNGIAVDGSGNIYVVGNTNSSNFPAVNAIQSGPGPTENCGNGFVTKLNPAVPSFVFSTYLGGNRCDNANSVAIDSSANVYVVGSTRSADFPLAGAFQGTIGDSFFGDAFITKLTSNGSMTYSTYLGGDSSDIGFGIAVDGSGNAYVTGSTSSTNFPTANPIQAMTSGGDAFVTKLNSQGSALVYSTYLGGFGMDVGRGIAIDSTGNAYVTGFANSPDFPLIAGALRTKSAVFKSGDGRPTGLTIIMVWWALSPISVVHSNTKPDRRTFARVLLATLVGLPLRSTWSSARQSRALGGLRSLRLAAACLVQVRVDRPRRRGGEIGQAYQLLWQDLEEPLRRAEVPQERAPARRADACSVSKIVLNERASRRWRWKPSAKRCASSRNRCRSCRPGECGSSTIGSGRSGHEDLLHALRERDHGDAGRSYSCIAASAAESCPLPPSITTRPASRRTTRRSLGASPAEPREAA